MINVVIVGSLLAIKRHADALKDFHDIRITGQWISEGEQDTAMDLEQGMICTLPEKILENADAAIITNEGNFCSQVVITALRNAKHVFLYPCVLQSVNEATLLIKMAREANVIFKAGKTGSMNTSILFQALPRHSEIIMADLQHSHPITDNGHDGISGAMLPDLDIICSLINTRVTSIKAKGMGMISPLPEILNARLEFDNGCMVNYNCSLVAAQPEFRMNLVMKNRILKYDFLTGELISWFVQQTDQPTSNPIFIESAHIITGDSLVPELTDFIDLIVSGPAFLSINDNGLESYLLADRIMDKVMKTIVRC
jgi:hypothetical protein